MNCTVTAILLLFTFVSGVLSQETTDTKEMRTLKLRLKEAQLVLQASEIGYKQAETSFKEAQSLFEKGLYNKKELAEAEEYYRDAELKKEQAVIDLEKTRLAFLNNALYVSLDRAALYRDNNDDKHVLLTLRNNSNIRKIIDDKGEYSEANKTALLSIENLTVRIMKDGKLIGRPFESKIQHLDYNQVRTIDFILQQETENVTIEMAYADTVVVLPVFLEKEARQDQVRIVASQFSQEGELGSKVNYDLELERFADDNESFTPMLLNLPQTFTTEFREINADNQGQDNRVSRIRFKKGVTTLGLQLSINMPKEIDKQILNEKITFFALVLDRLGQQRLNDVMAKAQGRTLTAKDLDSAGVTFESLELVPRGRAEIDIAANVLSVKSNLGDPIKFSFTLHNTGTVSLDRVRVRLALPMDWTANVVPEKDITLEVEAKQRIDVEVIPASDVVASDYDIRIEAKTQHEGRDIEATAKVMRVQIEGKSNFLIGAILMIVLIGLIVGVAVMTIKISRR